MTGFSLLESVLIVFALWLFAVGRTPRDRGARPRVLYLRYQGRQLQGVCRGIAEYFAVPVLLVRAATVVAFAIAPMTFLLYVLLGLAFEWHPNDTRDWLRTRVSRWLNRSSVGRIG